MASPVAGHAERHVAGEADHLGVPEEPDHALELDRVGDAVEEVDAGELDLELARQRVRALELARPRQAEALDVEAERDLRRSAGGRPKDRATAGPAPPRTRGRRAAARSGSPRDRAARAPSDRATPRRCGSGPSVSIESPTRRAGATETVLGHDERLEPAAHHHLADASSPPRRQAQGPEVEREQLLLRISVQAVLVAPRSVTTKLPSARCPGGCPPARRSRGRRGRRPAPRR